LIPTFELPEEDQAIYEKALAQENIPPSKGGLGGEKIQELTSAEWYLRYLSFKGLNWRFDYGLSEETIFELIQKAP